MSGNIGRFLPIVDEAHKQQGWSSEIKALYDAYPDKKLIVLGSSMLDILGGKGDVSRRIDLYTLDGLSFREYLNFTTGTRYESIDLETLLHDHLRLTKEIANRHPVVLRHFHEYCEYGYYPYFRDRGRDRYYGALINVLDKVLYEDIPSVKPIQASSSRKMKVLLAYLARSTIPLFNITSLSNEIGVVKDTLYDFIDLFERADILSVIRPKRKDKGSLKNAKLLLRTPNLYYAISEELWKHDPEKGNLREAFFASQLRGPYRVFASESVDFLVETATAWYEVEVGGPNKSGGQIAGMPNGILAKDGIEYGFANTIPLYAFGFLY